jgi:pentatricopeptide repeat domain-containing protein 1
LFQVVKDKKLPLDTYCYTAAIEACSKGGLWQKAIMLLHEMEENGIVPSEVTFNVVITACGNGGQWKKAMELLSVMRRRQIPVNLYVYNAAITALSKAAKKRTSTTTSIQALPDHEGQSLYQEAMALLDQMRKDGIEPDGFSFTSTISCCGYEGRWQEALELIRAMREGGPRTQPNKLAYTAAMTSCGKWGQVDDAILLFRQMQQQGLKADRIAYNSLFTALRIAKRSNEAFELWDEMLGMNKNVVLPTKKFTTPNSFQSTTPDIITVTE